MGALGLPRSRAAPTMRAHRPEGPRDRALLRRHVHARPARVEDRRLGGLAEERGFDAVWAWDSHVLWQEFYTTFALVAANTSRVRLGPCVTNPRRGT